MATQQADLSSKLVHSFLSKLDVCLHLLAPVKLATTSIPCTHAANGIAFVRNGCNDKSSLFNLRDLTYQNELYHEYAERWPKARHNAVRPHEALLVSQEICPLPWVCSVHRGSLLLHQRLFGIRYTVPS